MMNKNIPDNVRNLFQRSALWPSAATIYAFFKREVVVNSYWEDRTGATMVMGLENGANVLQFFINKTGDITVSRIDCPLMCGRYRTSDIISSKNSKYILRTLQNKDKEAGQSILNGVHHARSAMTMLMQNLTYQWASKNMKFPRVSTELSQDAMRDVLDVYFGRKQVLDISATISHKLTTIDQAFNERRTIETKYNEDVAAFFKKEKWVVVFRRMGGDSSDALPNIIIGALDGHQLHDNLMARKTQTPVLSKIAWTIEPEMYYGYQNIAPEIVDKVMARLTMMRRLRDTTHPDLSIYLDPYDGRYFARGSEWIEMPSISAVIAEPANDTHVILMDK